MTLLRVRFSDFVAKGKSLIKGGTKMEEKIGKVTHYFNKLGVAAVRIEHGRLRRGDRVHIIGHTTDTEQVVNSMELDHHQIEEAGEGLNVGIKVDERVRENDDIYVEKTYI